MNTRAELLTDALSLLRERGWAKNTSETNDGRVCASYANFRACEQKGMWEPNGSPSMLDFFIVDLANELFPRHDKRKWANVPQFNDYALTTFGMIEQTFEKAILRAQEMEGT